MTSALDMSLADIIKTQKTSRPRKGAAPRGARGGARGGRAAGPTRTGRQTRDKKPYTAGAQQYKATPVAPLHTSVIRQSVPDGSKMNVSNLDPRVSAEDLKLVFSSRVGPLKKCTLMYDQKGKPTGTALVHFSRVPDAALAMQKFNGVPLDGKPMRIELIIAPGAVQAALPSTSAPRAPRAAANNQRQPQRGQGAGRGGDRAGRGRGRGGRQQGEKKTPKTADQLDAEMTDYMQVDA
ncbi:hypothetical protein BGX29_003811 [Mortierella sp. GBA35]|nr:hypothetical protein BGX23_002924 [Mortierella sp. AD031]KAF9108881.1 hypothetical protein BGX29_003811 [Mortierella sp. GBA35]KAG0218269.1 hypothetical protein BGX33_007947 [Mortierella sp. NVP41]